MTNSNRTILFILLFISNQLLAQKILLTGEIKKSHLVKINNLIEKIYTSKKKYEFYYISTDGKKSKTLKFNIPFEKQIPLSTQVKTDKKDLIPIIYRDLVKTSEDNRNKNLYYTPLTDFDLNVPIPIIYKKLDFNTLLLNLPNHKKEVIVIALTPNELNIELEKPNVNQIIDKPLIEIKGKIKSDAEIKSFKYRFGSNYWQTLEIEYLINNNNGFFSFWVKDQWPFKSNVSEDLTIEVNDLEGNSKTISFGPFKKAETEISESNCFFRYYEKEIHDVAQVRNFRSSNVYWFPIYSEIDPSNLSFVLSDSLGREHISIRLVESINFVRNSQNEFCLGISGADLNIGKSNCELNFKGICYLRHNFNKSKSAMIEIHLKDWEPNYIAPLAECIR
jgi:hypothetical protein